MVRVFQRRIQVQLIERLDDAPREAGCQNKRQNDFDHQNSAKRQKKTQEEVPDRRLRDGKAQDRPVRELLRGIKLLL